MVIVTCSRSGLNFEAPNRRRKVHPEISKWTSHKNWEIRQIAVGAIAQGKSEGWDSLEKFEEEIDKALTPEEPEGAAVVVELRQASRKFGGAKPWLAKITGQCPTYGYSRKFLNPYHQEDFGCWKFAPTENGVYQGCNRNSKGDERRFWLQVLDGKRLDLTEEEAIAIVGEPAKTTSSPATAGKGMGDNEAYLYVHSEGFREYWDAGEKTDSTDLHSPLPEGWEVIRGEAHSPGEIFVPIVTTDKRDKSGAVRRETYRVSKEVRYYSEYDDFSEDFRDVPATVAAPLSDSEWESVLKRREKHNLPKRLRAAIYHENRIDAPIPEQFPEQKSIRRRSQPDFVAIDRDLQQAYYGAWNGASGDDWSWSNWNDFIVCVAKLTPEIQELFNSL